MEYKIIKKDNELILEFKPILANINNFSIKKDNEDQWPVKFFTATTNMKDFIGNIKEINNDKCVIRTFYLGHFRDIKNVKLMCKASKDDRVMLTEHLNINGHMEFIATKNRIIIGDVNFINIGWSDNNKCKYLRVDIYTAESKILECEPVFNPIE